MDKGLLKACAVAIAAGLTVFGIFMAVMALSKTDGAVKCGEEEMRPGQKCQVAGEVGVCDDGSIGVQCAPRTYEEMKEEQYGDAMQSDLRGQMTSGGVMVLVGGAGLFLLRRWRPVR